MKFHDCTASRWEIGNGEWSRGGYSGSVCFPGCILSSLPSHFPFIYLNATPSFQGMGMGGQGEECEGGSGKCGKRRKKCKVLVSVFVWTPITGSSYDYILLGFAGNRIKLHFYAWPPFSKPTPLPFPPLLHLSLPLPLPFNAAVMSEEPCHGNLWQNHSGDLLNSDSNSGGSGEDKVGEKPPDSSSNSPVENPPGMAVGGRKRVRRGKAASEGGGESEHETHIWTERERRKKMRNMFSSLHALLPQLPPKADKSTIVDEAVNYIKTLQNSLIVLQKQRHEMQQSATAADCETSIITSQAFASDKRQTYLTPAGDESLKTAYFSLPTNKPAGFLSLPPSPLRFQTWFSPNVVVSMCGNEAHISVCSSRKPGLLTTIFYILEKHKLDVLSAHISSTQQRSIYMIHAHAGGASGDHHQFPKGLGVEEIFKLAVGEMTLWLSSC